MASLTPQEQERLDAAFAATGGVKSKWDEPPTVVGDDPSVRKALGSMLAPTGTQIGIEAALTALGVPEVGLLPMALRALTAGGANVATSKLLPESMGGSPQSSYLADFAMGAAPEALSAGVPTIAGALAERKLAGKGAQLAKSGVEALDPEALAVQRQLLAPAGTQPFPALLGGAELTDATNQARGPIQQTIKAARQRYGRPIGDAYKSLKGEEPLADDEVRGLAEGAKQIQDKMIAPGPLTSRYVHELQNYVPASEAEKPLEHQLMEMPSGEFRQQGNTPPTELSLKLQGFSDKAIAQILRDASAPQYKAPTLDRFRDMRQRVNLDLQRAKGGDVYGLGMLQDHLDDLLMEHLPPEMGTLRTQYRGFIKRWGYEKERALSNLGHPQEVANWTFRDPAAAYDLMTEARRGVSPLSEDLPHDETGIEQIQRLVHGRSSETSVTNPRIEGVRSMFLQYAYGDLDPMASAADQAKAVRKKLAPYVGRPEVAKAMMGPGWPANMRGMVAWAKYSADFQEQYAKNPELGTRLDRGFRNYFLARRMDPDKAMAMAMRDVMRQMPGEEQATAEWTMGQLPPPNSVKRSSHNPMRNSALAYHGSAAALALAMGRPEALAWQAGMVMMRLATNRAGGFGAASRLGITREMVNAFGASGWNRKGFLFARALDAVIHGGAQFGSRVRPESDSATME